jgi:SAM-dependent methyltransferase
VEPLKRELPAVEKALKRDADDPLAVGRLVELLEALQRDVAVLFDALESPKAAAFTAELLGRELHPWLSKSFLAERCLARPHGASGSAEILAHLLLDRSGGDGPLGDHLDRWLLDRPTFRALRQLRDPMVQWVANVLPRHRNRRVLVVNAGTGSLVARLSELLVDKPTIVTVIDQSRDALSFLDAGMVQRREGVALETVQEHLASLAVGRSRHELPPHDAVVLHGLIEYMPERIAVSMLREARRWLAPDGMLVVASLLPSDDHRFIDRLLGWPTIRRSEQQTRDLFTAAELTLVDLKSPEPPALLVLAGVEEQTVLRPDMETEIRERPPPG